MRARSCSRALDLVLVVAGAVMLLGSCSKNHKESPGAGESVTKEQARELEELMSEAGKLQKEAMGLHARFMALPDDLAGLTTVRSMFYAVEEVVGVEEARSKWFAGELKAAAVAGNRQKIQGLSEQIHASLEGCQGTQKALGDMTRELVGFERRAAKREELAASGRLFSDILLTGFEVRGARGGAEEGLLGLIHDGATKVGKQVGPKPGKKPVWFTLDRVVVAKDGSRLDIEESKDQIETVAEIVKAHPTVKVAIGAFTDGSSPETAALKVSTDLAESVKQALVAAGVAAQRIEAEGHGSSEPLCPANDTDECRARNRRVAIRVTAK